MGRASLGFVYDYGYCHSADASGRTPAQRLLWLRNIGVVQTTLPLVVSKKLVRPREHHLVIPWQLEQIASRPLLLKLVGPMNRPAGALCCAVLRRAGSLGSVVVNPVSKRHVTRHTSF